jgi:hypothetical protein
MLHIGKIKATGRKCVVVFREIPDAKGKTIDENHCLVVETERLPDAEHEMVINLVNGRGAQSSPNIYDLFSRTAMNNGASLLTWLHKSGRLQKTATSDVIMTPGARGEGEIPLNDLNTIIRMQSIGKSDAQIKDALGAKNASPSPTPIPAAMEVVGDSVIDAPTTDSVLSDLDIGKLKLAQATTFETQAAELRKEAYKLDSSLKPVPRARKKAVAKVKE